MRLFSFLSPVTITSVKPETSLRSPQTYEREESERNGREWERSGRRTKDGEERDGVVIQFLGNSSSCDKLQGVHACRNTGGEKDERVLCG